MDVQRKELIEKYMMSSCWILLNPNPTLRVDQTQIDKVLTFIGHIEKKLRENGISEKGVQIILKRCEEFVNKKICELSDEETERYFKLVYGQKAHWKKM